jgi:hypothetical protein
MRIERGADLRSTTRDDGAWERKLAGAQTQRRGASLQQVQMYALGQMQQYCFTTLKKAALQLATGGQLLATDTYPLPASDALRTIASYA